MMTSSWSISISRGQRRKRARRHQLQRHRHLLRALAGLARPRRSVLRRFLRRHLRRAALRHHAAPRHPQRRARMIAANNIINALFMIVPRSPAQCCWRSCRARPSSCSSASANAVATLSIARLLRRNSRQHRPPDLPPALPGRGQGHRELPAAGRKAVIVANHSSFLDGPLLSAFLPERASFAINTQIAKSWWVKPPSRCSRCPDRPHQSDGAPRLVDALKKGRKVVIFPEGRITVTGALMKVYEGPPSSRRWRRPVLPVRIDGAQYTPFSRMRASPPALVPQDHHHRAAAGEPRPARGMRGAALRGTSGPAPRQDDQHGVPTSNIDRTCSRRCSMRAHTHGRGHVVVEDIQRKPLSYGRLIVGASCSAASSPR